jgi:hypothetical protein
MTTLSRITLSILLGFVLGTVPPSGLGQEKKRSEDLIEARVRLSLNALERSKLMERYAALLDREMSLQDSVRASAKSGDERLPRYQQALDEVRADMQQTRKKLTTLEMEKVNLLERLGAKNATVDAFEHFERVNHLLERILDRVEKVENA